MGVPLDQYDTLKFFSDEVIKIGADTKTTIQQRLGDPSTQATFGAE